jgi:energy-coupling factor transporter ATP-binding protein EcfA2
MKLINAHVTNFRSVEDSGEFSVEQVTCLVGKNEAGKSAVLLALGALHPHPSTPLIFDKERDYTAAYAGAESLYGAKEQQDSDLMPRSLPTGPRIARPDDKLRKRLEGWAQRQDSRPSFETPRCAWLLRMRSEKKLTLRSGAILRPAAATK